jgi:hypothetical protein
MEDKDFMNIDSIANRGFKRLIRFVVVHHSAMAILCVLYYLLFGNMSIVISFPVLIFYFVIAVYFGAFVVRFQRKKYSNTLCKYRNARMKL